MPWEVCVCKNFFFHSNLTKKFLCCRTRFECWRSRKARAAVGGPAQVRHVFPGEPAVYGQSISTTWPRPELRTTAATTTAAVGASSTTGPLGLSSASRQHLDRTGLALLMIHFLDISYILCFPGGGRGIKLLVEEERILLLMITSENITYVCWISMYFLKEILTTPQRGGGGRIRWDSF